jgi:hypothetical protein
MKRLRNSVEIPLDLKSIMDCGVGRDFINNHIKNQGIRLSKKIKFKMDIFPDATMKSDEKPYGYRDKQTVFVTPEQYELLITTHPKVLEVRLDDMEELVFTPNMSNDIYYRCLHSNLTVKDGYAEWEVIFY